jgi:hypothetical protein
MAQIAIRAVAEPAGIRFELIRKRWLGAAEPVPVDSWLREAEGGLALAVGRLVAWREEGSAEDLAAAVRVPHALVASLGDREAERLGLPPPPDFSLHIQHQGTIDQPSFALRWSWRTIGGQPVLGAQRTGCWLAVGERSHRLPRALFELVEAVEAFRKAPPDDEPTRWRCWTRLQELLPRAPSEEVCADRYLTSFVVAHAGTFSLDVSLDTGGYDFDPVLFAPRDRPTELGSEGIEPLPAREPEPLLTDDLQKVFSKQRFRMTDGVQARYTLVSGYYLVLDPDLEQALAAVRRVQLGDREARKAFAKNPRAALREALGDRLDEVALEGLFVETSGYSERVTELGLWQPPVLPWVQRRPGEWFPDDAASKPKSGLVVGGRPIEIPPERVPELRQEVEAAIRDGRPAVPWQDGTDTAEIPASQETLQALDQLRDAPAGGLPVERDDTSRDRRALGLEDNLVGVGFERAVRPRPDHGAEGEPTSLRTSLKAHQVEGLHWLKQAWLGGEPGVLLADDMGLGKTLQSLAFLDWVRRGQRRLGKPRPFLVVAPTSLIDNWRQEHALHLERPGLGDGVELRGNDLARWRNEPGQELRLGRSVLDIGRLPPDGWVLTTYETMRDYHLSLAAVPFSVVVLDEAQKIKNPASLVTWAAKTLNADFVLALTGTPVENRLADLWSIADRVQEGFLGDLKGFSGRYEQENAPPERLTELKEQVLRSRGARPPFMLRRM